MAENLNYDNLKDIEELVPMVQKGSKVSPRYGADSPYGFTKQEAE